MSLMPPSPTCSALTPYRVGLHLVVPWIPNRVGLCLEAPCTRLTRSMYPQGWILMPPPCWRCWKPCWWRWRPWRWSWRPYRSWRSPRWVGESLMTHSVVIHALMVSLYCLVTCLKTTMALYVWFAIESPDGLMQLYDSGNFEGWLKIKYIRLTLKVIKEINNNKNT